MRSVRRGTRMTPGTGPRDGSGNDRGAAWSATSRLTPATAVVTTFNRRRLPTVTRRDDEASETCPRPSTGAGVVPVGRQIPFTVANYLKNREGVAVFDWTTRSWSVRRAKTVRLGV